MTIHNFIRVFFFTCCTVLIVACGGETTVPPSDNPSSQVINGAIKPSFNRSGKNNESVSARTVLAKSVANASGSFNHPFDNETFAGNILASIDVNDTDGITAVAISFNQKQELLYLCTNSVECGGTFFHKTETHINPAEFDLYTGPLTLGLWVVDINQQQMQVDSVTINWQRRKISLINAQRSIAGDTLNLDWQSQNELINYNVYIASEPNVTTDNFQQLNDGKAFLSLDSNTHSITGLSPNKTYYVLITGVDGSGESAFSAEIRFDQYSGHTNTAPVAKNDNLSTNEDQILTGNLLSNDADNEDDLLTVSPIPLRSPFWGDVVLENNGIFTYSPPANFSGQDSFEYEIQDGQGGFSQAIVTINIGANNDAPVAGNDSYSIATNQNLTVAAPGVLLNDTDIDNDPLTINTTPVIDVTNGVLTLQEDGGFTYQPNNNFNGTDTFTYQVNDPFDLHDTAVVNIIVGGQNNPPTAINDNYTTTQNTTLIVDGINNQSVLANDSDIDGDSITLTSTLIDNVDNGTLTIDIEGLFTYIPNANFNGTDSFIYEITDGQGGLAQATVMIKVTAINQAPTAVNDTASVNEDELVTIDVIANDSDPDNDNLTIVSWQENNGVVILNAGKLDYTPNSNFNGSDTLDYTISDSNGHTSTATVNITVVPVNDNPVAVDDSAIITLGDIIKMSVLFNDSDVDGDSLSITSASTDSGNVVINNDNTITFSGAVSVGTAIIIYTISDGNGGSDSATITITINAANQAPTANDDIYSVDQDTVLNVDNINEVGLLNNDSDPENDLLTVSITPVTDVSDGILTLADDGTFVYTPNTGFYGDDGFEYEINDGNGNTATAFVDITVNQVNIVPVAKPDYYTTLPNSNLTVDGTTLAVPLSNDTDADYDTLVFSGVYDNVENGVLTESSDSSFDYHSNNNFTGVDSFVYEIDDGNGGFSRALVTLTVSKFNWDGNNALPNIVLADYQGISFDGSRYYIVANGNILTSSDVINWNNLYQNLNTPLLSIASGNSADSPQIKTAIAVGEVNKALTQQSANTVGIWAKRTTNTNKTMTNVELISGNFVSTGLQSVMFSSDGVNWVTRTPNSAVVFNSVIKFNNQYIIVGDNGVIETSLSGVNWAIQTSNSSQILNDITASTAIMVAVGNSGTILTSNDGNIWTQRTSNTTSNLKAIAYGTGIFMAVGDNSTVITSNDGISWTAQPGIDSQPLNDVIHDGNKFVLVGEQAYLFTSNDGISFQQINVGDHRNYTALATNGSDIIRAGTNTQIYKSTDGISWAQISNQTYAINKIEFFNDSFIAIGDNGLILTSPNGNVWTTQNAQTTNNINDVFWFSGFDVQGAPFTLYVAVGDSGLLLTSSDAINWQQEQTSQGTIIGENFYGIAHDNDYFIVVGTNGRILVRNNTPTPNGTTWMDFFSNQTYGQLNDIIYNGSTNIIVGNNGIIITGTAQGGVFSPLNTNFVSNLNAITFSGSNYVIAGDGGIILYSNNGLSWLQDISGTTHNIRDVLINTNVVHAVGDSGTYIKADLN